MKNKLTKFNRLIKITINNKKNFNKEFIFYYFFRL